MINPIKTFAPNLLGRDFCIGDLHGSYSVFLNLLKELNFDFTVDRMFSVGDLVDRGPESLKCLGLIREPWFASVLANHEQMMVQKFNGGFMGEYWYRNGGFWGAEAFNDTMDGCIPAEESVELHELIPLVEELPFLITVNTKSGKKFHLIHAELPTKAGIITDARLADPVDLLELATTQRGDGDAFLWSRNIFYNLYSKNLGNKELTVASVKSRRINIFNDDLSHIISGHTILQKPVTVVGQTNIDTGAYNSYWQPAVPYSSAEIVPKDWAALTCVDLDTWKFYQATETTFREVEPVVITQADLDGK